MCFDLTCTYSSSTLSHIFVACTYLATGFSENRSTFFRKAASKENSSLIENPEDDEESAVYENKNEPVTLTGREGKFQEVDTIHKKYSERPKALKDMCLAQFATSYHPTRTSADSIVWDKEASVLQGGLYFFGSKFFFLAKFCSTQTFWT